jgi:hypothetical protein
MLDTLPADEQMADIGGTEYPVEVRALESDALASSAVPLTKRLWWFDSRIGF